jgi:hypothetical protein
VSTCTLPRNKPAKYDFNVAFDEVGKEPFHHRRNLPRASVPVRLFSRRPGLSASTQQLGQLATFAAIRIACEQVGR